MCCWQFPTSLLTKREHAFACKGAEATTMIALIPKGKGEIAKNNQFTTLKNQLQ